MAAILFLGALFLLSVNVEPISADRYEEPDRLFQKIEANVRNHAALDVIVNIDHSRLGAEAGSPMPPSHVLIYSDSSLDAAIIKENPTAAIDLPLRVLVYEDQKSGEAKVISNSFDFVAKRHSLSVDDEIRSLYDATVTKATQGISEEATASFRTDIMPSSGLVTLKSPYSYVETVQRVTDAIKSQSDTVIFGTLDFAERSKIHNVSVGPMQMILFGGPGPGGKAMTEAPTLGLDAFCQKLLILQADHKTVHVVFNDLLVLAERQGVQYGLPLRIINRRLKKTFSTALEK